MKVANVRDFATQSSKGSAMRWCIRFTACTIVCMVAMVTYIHPTQYHHHFFSAHNPLHLELWSKPAVARWMPCSWWWGAPRTRPTVDNSNGYIIIACAGGLNQMRRDFCNGVGIARLLNATLLLPRFEASPYWNDTSGFSELFDVEYFLERVHGWVDVLRELPVAMAATKPVAITCHKGSGPFDYTKTLLPQLSRHKLILLRPSASQLRSNPNRNIIIAKRARCQACYRSLRPVKSLRETAESILTALPHPFVALHLRFEPDMIAYSRCRYNNRTMAFVDAVRGVRQVLGDAAEKAWRRKGKCPLTPRETRVILQAIGFPASTPIYVAAGAEVLELHELTATYWRVLQKSDFLPAGRLRALKGSSRAAVDWVLSVRADVYIATFVGNMDKMVVTDRILAGQHRNLVLDRRAFAEAQWQGKNGAEISELMVQNHRQHVAYGLGLPVSDCLCKAY